MSRSGYIEDIDDNWQLIRWRGAVASSLKGKRGQAFLGEALTALDALPEPKLISHKLGDGCGVCTLGAVGAARGMPITEIDPDDHEHVASLFAIPHALACEIMWENDEGSYHNETPEHRWTRMRRWIVSNLKALPSSSPGTPEGVNQTILPQTEKGS